MSLLGIVFLLMIRHLLLEMMEDNIVNSFQLVEITDVSGDCNQTLISPMLQHTRQLEDTVSLPLHVVVKGPANSSDFALSYLMEVLEDNIQDRVPKLKSLD